MTQSRVLTICTRAVLAIAVSGPLWAYTGAETFKAKCAMCHGQDGGGNTPLGKRMKVRDLRSADVQNQSTESITAIVTNGQKAMPAFSKSLDAEAIKDVVGFVRNMAAK